MKVFIAGSINVKKLDREVLYRLKKIIKEETEVLIGDANGVDKLVQEFFLNENYKNVTIFATSKKPRNNIGKWEFVYVDSQGKKGREKHTLKDIEMSKQADIGLMIWDGKSQGTLNNSINLVFKKNLVAIYLDKEKRTEFIKEKKDLDKLMSFQEKSTQNLYTKLLENKEKSKIKNSVSTLKLNFNVVSKNKPSTSFLKWLTFSMKETQIENKFYEFELYHQLKRYQERNIEDLKGINLALESHTFMKKEKVCFISYSNNIEYKPKLTEVIQGKKIQTSKDMYDEIINLETVFKEKSIVEYYLVLVNSRMLELQEKFKNARKYNECFYLEKIKSNLSDIKVVTIEENQVKSKTIKELFH